MPKSFLLTGLSGAGKTTLSKKVQELLQNQVDLVLIDGDEMRHGINSDLGFSRKDREENIRRCGEMAKLLASQGKSTLLALIAPYDSLRIRLQEILGPDSMRIIHVSCPLEICISRDPKANYRKALSGHIQNYTGIADSYEIPANAHLVIETHKTPIEDCAKQIGDFILRELAS